MGMNTKAGPAAALVAFALALGPVPLRAQEATERFIPLGRSPGLSGVVTVIGEVVAADAEAMTITVDAEGAQRTVTVGPGTRVWLDRSALRQANTTGGMGDLQLGRTVEVKYVDPDAPDVADWIKVAIESG